MMQRRPHAIADLGGWMFAERDRRPTSLGRP
jgi:hypothetical protein